MPELTIFSFDSRDIRVITDSQGNPWFVAADVLSVLTLDRKALERLDDDEKGVSPVHTPGGAQSAWRLRDGPSCLLVCLGSANTWSVVVCLSSTKPSCSLVCLGSTKPSCSLVCLSSVLKNWADGGARYGTRSVFEHTLCRGGVRWKLARNLHIINRAR